MNEKNRELKCTLAACLDGAKANDAGYEKLPLHCTIAPPFIVSEEKYPELVAELYNVVSSWSSELYDNDEATNVMLEQDTKLFGTVDNPVLVRRIDPKCGEQLLNLLALRELTKEAIEAMCGQEVTNGWYNGELHVSETEDILPEKNELLINSLSLFIKRNNKWYQDEVFYWNE